MIVHFEGHQPTAFDQVAGHDATLDFVRSFLQWLPIIILFLCLSNFCNLFSKCMKALKLDEYTYYNYYDPDRLEPGKQLLAQERSIFTSNQNSPDPKKSNNSSELISVNNF